MLWIVVTSPTFFIGEASFLHRLLACGVDFIHLRKPDATVDECSELLNQIENDDCKRIIVHDFFELVKPYNLHGIHLNSRHKDIPSGYHGHISRSCHSLEEVSRYKESFDYVFLSPIFDSVSKKGYSSAFDDKTLKAASENCIIDDKVIALGGVTLDKIDYLRNMKFGGVAMLGCINNLAALPEEEQTEMLKMINKKLKKA